MFKKLTFLLGTVALLLGGCSQAHSTDTPNFLTFQRGQQLLAAGSPKSAIPLLTQSIASAPDGPEPVALLALAYALDLQDQRAIVQAGLVRRPAGNLPGWEAVAIGIAELTQHHNARAIEVLKRTAICATPGTSLSQASIQWLAVAYLLDGDRERATAVLECLANIPQMHATAILWIMLIEAQQGDIKGATDHLITYAKMSSASFSAPAISGDLTAVDSQALYDAGIGTLAKGDLKTARQYFEALQERNPTASDAGIWLALISGAERNWQECRNGLKAQSQTGTDESRGLANQLFSLVCALEDRPDDVILATLSGQRLLGRNSSPAYIIEPPKPEPVWGSDYMK